MSSYTPVQAFQRVPGFFIYLEAVYAMMRCMRQQQQKQPVVMLAAGTSLNQRLLQHTFGQQHTGLLAACGNGGDITVIMPLKPATTKLHSSPWYQFTIMSMLRGATSSITTCCCGEWTSRVQPQTKGAMASVGGAPPYVCDHSTQGLTSLEPWLVDYKMYVPVLLTNLSSHSRLI